MKKYNQINKIFEDYQEEDKNKEIREQLIKDKVPYFETKDGLFIEDKNITIATATANKIK